MVQAVAKMKGAALPAICVPSTGGESMFSRLQNTIRGQRRPSTLRLLWILIHLRHQLLWAQTRTSSGRRALFIAGYALGGSLLLGLILAGSAVAAFPALQERGGETTRWILAGIWVNGATLNLLLGRGTRQSSLDTLLRRYPLTRTGRLFVRHLSGLLDPIWLLLSAAAFGVALGCATAGPEGKLLVLPVALLFVGICYLSSLVVLSVADLILSRRGGGTIIGAVAFVAFLAGVFLAASALDPAGDRLWLEADFALRFLPPGAAASLLAGMRSPSCLLDLATLLLWCGFLIHVLALAERRTLSNESVTSVSDAFGSLCDRIAGLFGDSLGPLIGKALRYHLRCDRVRFSFAGTVPLVLLLPRLMSAGSGPYTAFLETVALMFMAAILATSSITLNQFGYDGDAVRRYWILPVPAVSAVRAGSIASLLLGGVPILAGLAGLPFLAGFPVGARAAVIILSSSAAGLFFFNAIGLWTSVLSPRRSNFRGVMGNELSFSATLVIGLGIALTLAAAFAVREFVSPAQFLDLWWIFLLLPISCVSLYVISYRSIPRVMTAHREALTRAVSGADRS
jgi:hypothetical protein